jgi:hypothetical protein
MLRKLLAFIAGFITFGVVVTLIQLVSGLIFGMPSPETIGDQVKMAAFVAAMSTGGFVGLLLSYIIGSFVSGFVTRVISRWESLLLPILIGLIGTVAWTYNVTQIPHPMWVTVLGFFCYIPFAILGHRAAAGTGGR